MITPELLARAGAIIRQGGLVAFPTETVYGLGANALDAEAVERIFEVKGRPPSSPLIVHVDSVAMARELAREWPAAAEELTRAFWPGPLTLVLPKLPLVPDNVTAGLPTVGLRQPQSPNRHGADPGSRGSLSPRPAPIASQDFRPLLPSMC